MTAPDHLSLSERQSRHYARKAAGLDIFERRPPRDPYGYRLVMPHVLIGADEVAINAHQGVITATQTEPDGRTYTGTAPSIQGAILALIADRMGFTATIEIKPEVEDDET